VAAKVKEGMPFEEAVEKYSEGKEKEKGGDMGFLHKGRLEPKIEEEVLALKPGEIAGPFRAFEGYYIFRLEAFKPERMSTFDEIKQPLMADLTRKGIEARSQAWMKGLKSKAEIVIKDEAYLKAPLAEHEHSQN
jgi:parvulin-like peptidyl-prolyl isomerase